MERTGPPDAECFYAFLAIFRQGYPFVRVPYQDSAKCRNDMGRALLDDTTGLTHLVMLDIDHAHAPDTVYRLCKAVGEHPDRLVVGGLNFRRSAPHDPCVFAADANGQYLAVAAWPQSPFRVEIIGSGCIIIAREVFERIEFPWFYRDFGTLAEPKNAGDDVNFSLKCRASGIDLWCDPTISSPHLAAQWITAQSYIDYVRGHPDEFSAERIAALDDIVLPELPIADR